MNGRVEDTWPLLRSVLYTPGHREDLIAKAGRYGADALCLVLRGFADDEVAGEDEPVASLSVLELELVLADLEAVESALTRARKVTRVNAAAAGSTMARNSNRSRTKPMSGSPLNAHASTSGSSMFHRPRGSTRVPVFGRLSSSPLAMRICTASR